MNRSKAAAGALALFVLGGGLIGNHLVNAASTTGGSTANTAIVSEMKGLKGEFVKRGEFGFAKGAMNEQLAEFLNLEADALRDKLAASTLAEIAGEQGVSEESLKAKLVEVLEAEIASKVKQLNELDTSAMAETMMSSNRPEGGRGFGGKHGGMLHSSEGVLNKLGLTPEQFRAERQSGKTIAEIAEAQKVDIQEIIDLQVSKMIAVLDRQLADKKITQEEYENRKAEVEEKVTAMVNGEAELKGGMRGPHGD